MSSILIRYPNAEVAQLVEHWSEEPGVVSSILTLGTKNICRGSSVVEQCLDKALVKSSILFLGTSYGSVVESGLWQQS